jgi:hypothetical protein
LSATRTVEPSWPTTAVTPLPGSAWKWWTVGLDPGLCYVRDDRARQWVLAGCLDGRSEHEQLIGVPAGQRPGGDQAWRALGEGAGLVQYRAGGGAQPFHHDGGFDQHPAPAGGGDRGEQGRHGGRARAPRGTYIYYDLADEHLRLLLTDALFGREAQPAD